LLAANAELEEQKRKPRSVDDDFIEMVKKNVKYAADSLRVGALPPKPSEKACRQCDFKMLCSDGCKLAINSGEKNK